MKVFFKRLLLSLLGLLSLLVLIILIVAGIIFYDPTIIINPKNLDYALKKTSVLESWSWKEASIKHEWIAWNERRFYGGFSDLCLVYDSADVNVDTCLDAVSWNVQLGWNKKEGFHYKVYEPLVVNSSKLKVHPKDNPEETPPPDLMSYWDILWGPLIPDLIVQFKKIEILKEKPLVFDLMLNKTNKELHAEALGFHLDATKEKINIFAPKKVLLPFDLKTKNPLYFSELKLEARVLEKEIPILVTAKIESAVIKIESLVEKSSLKEDLSTPRFLSKVLQKTKGSIEVFKVKDTAFRLVRPPYNILPAPFNAMEGTLKINLLADKYQSRDSVLLKIKVELDMHGAKQDLVLAVNSEVPFDLSTNTVGAVALGLDLQKVKLLLPKLSRTRLPPQLIPDSRFKNSAKIVKENLNDQKLPSKVKKSPVKKDVEVDLKLQALGDNALALNTNLLDETLRMNFDLEIADGEIQKGFIQTMPFRTTVFKRKLHVTSVRIVYNYPLEPQVFATIVFELPEYKITLSLEGPMSKPRQAFKSEPPLPVDDIYAVLLFGRPLSGLDTDDKSAAKTTNQILSQGFLSLAVLYYFAGTPIESLTYDPESSDVIAQVGLGSKSSIRVGGSGEGLNSAGVRRSLGKGWYIDSSVQRSTKQTDSNNYGVLLERVISY